MVIYPPFLQTKTHLFPSFVFPKKLHNTHISSSHFTLQTRSITSSPLHQMENNNMSSYSKMTMKPNTTNFTSPKPKSMDFSELIHENNFNQHGHLRIMEEEEDEDSTVNGEQFGDILRRNRSSVSQRFRSSEKGTSLQDVVKRAFSMRRPSSVAECYWRFHDIGDGVMVHEDDEEQQQQQQQQQEPRACSKRKGRRFFKACKSFLKF